MRIGFAGSATNPSHLGHLAVLRLILAYYFDLVFWYPSGFSDKPGLIDGIHRQQFAHLAFPQEWIYAPEPRHAKLMLDLSATMLPDVPTSERFRRLHYYYPGAELFFITGSDAVTPTNGVLPIEKWHRYYAELCNEQILIVPRSGFALPQEIKLPPNLQWIASEPLPDISSSQIRKLVREEYYFPLQQQTWRQMVNDKVASYIDLHQLYLQE